MDSNPEPKEDPLSGFGLFEDGDAWIDGLRRAEATTDGSRVGGYRILASIEGGQGIVYRATRDDGSGDVALKRLGRGSFATDAMRRRFEREIESALELDHPGIAKVHRAEVIEGHLVLVMDWIDGLPIDRHVAETILERKPDAILACFLELCDAVSFAHRRGVIHRDIKPSNVLVDRAGNTKLLDFGLARRLADDDSLTRASQFLGTPAYAPPEQSNARDHADTRCDVFSLGVLLFELLTGELPADPESGRIRRLSECRVVLAGPLERIVERATAPSIDDRYSSVAALEEDLRRFLRGEPIALDALAAFRRMRRVVLRHRVFAAFLLSIGIGAIGWGLLQARHHEELDAKQVELTTALEDARRNWAQSTQTMVFFIHEILDRADPIYSAGEFTVKDALLATEARIESLDSYKPISLLILRESLADIFFALDDLERAERHMREALRLDIELHGEAPPYGTGRKSDLARILAQAGRLDEARELLVDATRIEAGEVAAPEMLVTSLLESLAVFRRASGEFERAAKTFEAMFDLHAKAAGAPVPWWDEARCHHAWALVELGELAEAERVVLAALAHPPETQVAVAFPEARLRVVLASIHRTRGATAIAATSAQGALEALRACVGADHRDTLRCEIECALIALGSGVDAVAKSTLARIEALQLGPRPFLQRALSELRSAIERRSENR